MATVFFKVAVLTVKTLSKPLASRFESYVLNHPVLRTQVINLAQNLHRLTVRIDRGAEGRTGRAFVGDMTEEKALQLASKVVSEGFIYGTAIVLLLLETDRRKKEDVEKRKQQLKEKADIIGMHERHILAEEELRQRSTELAEILAALDLRVLRLEIQNVS